MSQVLYMPCFSKNLNLTHFMYQVRKWVLIFQNLINILIRMMVLLHFVRTSMQLSSLVATTEINVSMMALAPDTPSI